jgi:hypothetical protein
MQKINMRTLYGKPIRKDITDSFYPNKLSLDRFRACVNQAIDPFSRNMVHLGGKAAEEKYIEEWFEQFLSWMEVEQER